MLRSAALRVHRNAPAAPFIREGLRSVFPIQTLFNATSPFSPSSRRENATLANPLIRAASLPVLRLSPTCVILMASMRAPVVMPSRVLSRPIALSNMQMRCFSSRRNPWSQNGNNDWVTTAKTGALVALGAGVLIASTSRTCIAYSILRTPRSCIDVECLINLLALVCTYCSRVWLFHRGSCWLRRLRAVPKSIWPVSLAPLVQRALWRRELERRQTQRAIWSSKAAFG